MVIDEEKCYFFCPEQGQKKISVPCNEFQTFGLRLPMHAQIYWTAEDWKSKFPIFSDTVYTHNTSEVADLSNTQDACFTGTWKIA